MMKAVSTSETSINSNEAIRCNSVVSHLHARRRENLTSHKLKKFVRNKETVYTTFVWQCGIKKDEFEEFWENTSIAYFSVFIIQPTDVRVTVTVGS
jgi:hypothetical protein